MKNEEKLYLAIGEIDEELIKEASLPYKAKLPRLHKGLTIAASVTLVSAAVLVGAMLMGDPSLESPGSASDIESNNQSNDGMDGNPTDTAPAIISNAELIDEYTVRFSMNVTDKGKAPPEIKLIGKRTSDDAETVNGICSTVAPDGGFDVILSPIITVNGEHADTLPTDPGVYEVTLDFSVITEYNLEWDNTLIINDQDFFKIK